MADETPETNTINVIRKKVIVIRGGTKTRTAIKIIVTQEARNADGEILLPCIEFIGDIDKNIESSRFARDVGFAFLIASHYCEEWSQYVNGKR